MIETNVKKNKTLLIGFDADSTLFNSLDAWIDWANEVSPVNSPIMDKSEWLKAGRNADWSDHGKFMKENMGIHNPFSFWEQPKLYQNVKPFPGAIEFITNLKKTIVDQGLNIKMVVVTTCVPEHEISKRMCLKKYFKNMFDGFISTSDKGLCGLTILFDDKLEHCEHVIEHGGVMAFMPEVGLKRPQYHQRIIAPETPYGGIWEYLLQVDPNGQKLIDTVLLDS